MCGRFALTSNPELLAELFALATIPDFLMPRYNVAPTQPAAVVRTGRDGERRLELLHWGLIPWWAKEPGIGGRMINARSESAASKPVFAEPLRRRRCLVPADGFFEWKKLDGGKQPYMVRFRDETVFAMAGLWERWRSPEHEDDLESFTILTTTPNDAVRELHDRMPVIIRPADYERWLDPEEREPEELVDLLRPIGGDLMTTYPVSRRVNRPENDDPGCVDRVEEPPPETLFG